MNTPRWATPKDPKGQNRSSVKPNADAFHCPQHDKWFRTAESYLRHMRSH